MLALPGVRCQTTDKLVVYTLRTRNILTVSKCEPIIWKSLDTGIFATVWPTVPTLQQTVYDGCLVVNNNNTNLPTYCMYVTVAVRYHENSRKVELQR